MMAAGEVIERLPDAGSTIAINGKFLAHPMTGVHRVAGALIRELDQLAADEDGGRWEIVAPRDAKAMQGLQHIATRVGGLFTWQPWEQFDLPRLARGRLLVNLCNLAPIFAPSVTLIHDAQVYITPQSYSPAFVSWYRLALPQIGRSALKIVTVSEYSRDQLVKYGVAPRDKIAVVHNGVDHILGVKANADIVARHGLTPGGYVVALANVQAHKNIAVLFGAISAIPDLKLVLVGADGRDAFIQGGHAPPDNVLFAGRLSDEEMRGLFEAALCFACPSKTEGFGLPPLEAMLVGCPAVIAPCGALPEVCGDAALVADEDDPRAWAAAFGLLRAENEASARRAVGIQWASRFTWRRAGASMHGLVEEAARTHAANFGGAHSRKTN